MFGWTIDEQRSFEVLDAYVAAGGNFIDTADAYGRRGPGGSGESERIIGRWMAARGNREQLVIATKVGISAELPGLSRATIRRGIEGSLERLGIETVDLYYAHRDDPETPLQETLGAFSQLIEEGRSAMRPPPTTAPSAWKRRCVSASEAGIASYVALQPQYNLLSAANTRASCDRCANVTGSRASRTSASRGAS